MPTKDKFLERMLNGSKPKCPDCGQEMKIWIVPEINACEGLGWGYPYLFVCFNDECSAFVNGWKNMKTRYGKMLSYRNMYEPVNPENWIPENAQCIIAMGGYIVEEEILAAEKRIQEAIKNGTVVIANFIQKEDFEPILEILLDTNQPEKVRIEAAKTIGQCGELEMIDRINACDFFGTLKTEVEEAVKKIHTKWATRECPYCAEIIKKKATICKHCGSEV